MMTFAEAELLAEKLKKLSFLREIVSLQHTPKPAAHSFNLIGTNFFLDIVPVGVRYYSNNRFILCWEKKAFLWQSYTFFDVIKEVPDEIGNKLLFHINIFHNEGEFRYKF